MRSRNERKLQKFKDICHKWLVIKDDEYIDIQFGVYFANMCLDSKPVWMYIVGPPGSGKTEILQAFDGHKDIYSLSSLTGNTLISGKIQGPKEGDPSLLPKLNGKVLIIKDFTVILKDRHETVAAIIGQLRDAYDGTTRKAFGTGKDIEYRSKFGIIAAVTNEIDKHLGRLSALGERFLIYRCPQITEAEKRARADKASQNINVTAQEREIRKYAHLVLNLEPSIPKLPEYRRKLIRKAALFVARARASVERNRYTREPIYLPEPEVPTRLTKQLCDLAMGITMAREKQQVGIDEVRLARKVALDCISVNRLSVLKILAEHFPAYLRPKEVADALKLSYNTAKYWLDDLYLLEVVAREDCRKSKHALPSYRWKLTDKYGPLLERIWDL